MKVLELQINSNLVLQVPHLAHARHRGSAEHPSWVHGVCAAKPAKQMPWLLASNPAPTYGLCGNEAILIDIALSQRMPIASSGVIRLASGIVCR